MMEYRSISDLSQCIRENMFRIPADVDLVVGIPRSGLLAALMIGLHRNLAVADIDRFARGEMTEQGTRTLAKVSSLSAKTTRHVLVVDDTLHSGQTMQEVKVRLRSIAPAQKITYCVVYGPKFLLGAVDLRLEELRAPHVFEWNLNRNAVLANSCVDMDGVLCRNPSLSEDDDGDAYRRFVNTAKLLWRPERRLQAIVTSRLERYRQETEGWLAAHQISYGSLIMLDVPDARARRYADIPKYKAEAMLKLNASCFIESAHSEAVRIAQISRRDVLCFDTNTWIDGSGDTYIIANVKHPGKAIISFVQFASRFSRRYPEGHWLVGPMRRFARRFVR